MLPVFAYSTSDHTLNELVSNRLLTEWIPTTNKSADIFVSNHRVLPNASTPLRTSFHCKTHRMPPRSKQEWVICDWVSLSDPIRVLFRRHGRDCKEWGWWGFLEVTSSMPSRSISLIPPIVQQWSTLCNEEWIHKPPLALFFSNVLVKSLSGRRIPEPVLKPSIGCSRPGTQECTAPQNWFQVSETLTRIRDKFRLLNEINSPLI